MKAEVKQIIIITVIVIGLLIFGAGGYWFGYGSGKNAGHNEGLISGNSTGYKTGYEGGYSVGYDKEFVVTHLDQYVTVPKVVSYNEVVTFLVSDQTDKAEYSAKDFDCTSFSNMVRNNATEKGIKCGLVSFDLVSPQKTIGHVIVVFETTDRGTVYFDPQTDGQRYGIYVGGTYSLQGITYKITKVDVIW
jgi:hypothetical protein